MRRRAPLDEAERRALRDHYRALGLPDQAGRWGICLPEGVSGREFDRLARMLAGRGIDDDVEEMLRVRHGELPELLRGRLSERVQHYDALFTRRSERRHGVLEEHVLDDDDSPLSELGIGLMLGGPLAATVLTGAATMSTAVDGATPAIAFSLATMLFGIALAVLGTGLLLWPARRSAANETAPGQRQRWTRRPWVRLLRGVAAVICWLLAPLAVLLGVAMFFV